MIVLELGSQTIVACIGAGLYSCQTSSFGDNGSRCVKSKIFDFDVSSLSWFESSQPESSDNVSSKRKK